MEANFQIAWSHASFRDLSFSYLTFFFSSSSLSPINYDITLGGIQSIGNLCLMLVPLGGLRVWGMENQVCR